MHQALVFLYSKDIEIPSERTIYRIMKRAGLIIRRKTCWNTGYKMRFVICGNGLDLHLGFETGYNNYRDYLENKNSLYVVDGKSAISKIENSRFFIDRDSDCWSDLENSLSFDIEQYISDIVYAYDRDISRYDEKNVERQIRAAKAFSAVDPDEIARLFTDEWFFEWILGSYENGVLQIDESEIRNMSSVINDESIYLTFNYTPTLEDIFGIDKDRILYIHNRFPDKIDVTKLADDSLNKENKKFQFGSTKNKFSDWMDFVSGINLKNNGNLIDKSSIEKKIGEIFYYFSKDLAGNYETLRDYVLDKSIDEVFVLGHSVLGVDEPYYRDILIPTFKNKKWVLYWHQDRHEIDQFVSKYALMNYEIIEW